MGDDRAAEASEWMPPSMRPETAGLVPLPQKQGRVPVVEIRYSAKAREVFGYLRALIASGEKSERGLALTEEAILINCADYTAWEYRWLCLVELDKDHLFHDEVAFVGRIATATPKNYQLWNHRRKVALRRGEAFALEELEFAQHCLAVDAKNYHAWAHRQEIVEKFGLWSHELSYVGILIQEDVRNNSAWNQRFFIVANAPRTGPLNKLLEEEIAYVSELILKAPHNESAWNYLRGLVGLYGEKHTLAVYPTFSDICLKVLAKAPSCPPAWSLLADVYAEQANFLIKEGDSRSRTAASRALHCYRQLMVADPIRSNYWSHCARRLPSK